MCVIVDVNNLHKLFLNGTPTTSSLKHLKNKLVTGKAKMAFGGKLKDEYLLCRKFVPMLAELKRSGIAQSICDRRIGEIEDNLSPDLLASNDKHILALAIASGARILVTDDDDLKIDFKNTTIISPKGKIYPGKGYEALLQKYCC